MSVNWCTYILLVLRVCSVPLLLVQSAEEGEDQSTLGIPSVESLLEPFKVGLSWLSTNQSTQVLLVVTVSSV